MYVCMYVCMYIPIAASNNSNSMILIEIIIDIDSNNIINNHIMY